MEIFTTEKSEQEKNIELIISIVKTKKDLELSNRNFEFAEDEMIDYFLYQIKAQQAKLDYLVKQAKKRKIELDVIDAIPFNQDKVV